MAEIDRHLTASELAAAKLRLAEAVNLHDIEGNPLDGADIAMFEMFHRERWSHERCLAYILEQAAKDASPPEGA